jgi:RNA-directed DNA polymerase
LFFSDCISVCDQVGSPAYEELKADTYKPQPVRKKMIPKPGEPGKERALGIPRIYDRVCQQALANRLEPVFDDANFGYRKGRSTKDALRKVWKELKEGREWIVDADLQDFFGSVDHEKLLLLIRQRIADGRVLGIIEHMLKAGCFADGETLPTEQGTPQGGVVSPLLSNILLTPFDWEMSRKGYRLTRYADDWVITCRTQSEAKAALAAAQRILEKLGVKLNVRKTRIVHVWRGFAFLGFLLKRTKTPLELPPEKIRSDRKAGDLYAYPRKKSINNFKERIRQLTSRKAPVNTQQMIEELNPVIRGWGTYYCRSSVRRLFARLDGWIVRRLWSHRYKCWCNYGWKELPERRLYLEMGLVNLRSLMPSNASSWRAFLAKAGCGKSARPV